MADHHCLYGAPEQIKFQPDPPSEKFDTWSAGVILYEMISGIFPFNDPDPYKIRDRIASTDPPAIVGLNQEIQTVISGLLKKNPLDRLNIE